MGQKVKFIVMMFVAVLLGSCAKNGEYKNCDIKIENIEYGSYYKKEYPDAEVCEVTYYENDERIWAKTTLDGATINEQKWGENYYKANYNLDGDTTYFYVGDGDETVYEKSTFSGGGVELRATFYNRKDITLYRRQYINGKLNLKYTGCKKQFDENGDYSAYAKEVWCDCPNEDLDKYLEDLLNSCK